MPSRKYTINQERKRLEENKVQEHEENETANNRNYSSLAVSPQDEEIKCNKRIYTYIYSYIIFKGSLRAEFGAHIQVKDGENPYGANLVLKG